MQVEIGVSKLHIKHKVMVIKLIVASYLATLLVWQLAISEAQLY